MGSVRKKEFDDEGYLSYVMEPGGGLNALADINVAVAKKLPAGTSVAEARAYVRDALLRAAAAAPELCFEYAVIDADKAD